MRVAFTALMALCLAACGGSTQSRETPTYEAVTLAGADVSLASLRGRPVLLNVWATWCGPCREEIPYLAELQKTHAASGLRIIGVSIDAARDRDKVAAMAPQLGITYDVWLDPDERIAGIVRYGGVPASMLVDRNGAVVWKHVGVLRAGLPGLEQALQDAARPAS